MSNDRTNARASVLTSLASGDNLAKAMTIGLILVSGGANFWETKAGNQFNAREIERATQEIHELYPKLMEAINNQNKLMDANTAKLHNQTEMLQNQKRILELLQAGQRRFFGEGTEHP